MTVKVYSERHPHPIVPWAVEEKCFLCDYPASHKIRDDERTAYHPLTAYVCCDHFMSNCSNGGARCKKCGHELFMHEREIKLIDQILSECAEPMGMGDWCGCRETRYP